MVEFSSKSSMRVEIVISSEGRPLTAIDSLELLDESILISSSIPLLI